MFRLLFFTDKQILNVYLFTGHVLCYLLCLLCNKIDLFNLYFEFYSIKLETKFTFSLNSLTHINK